MPVPDHMHDAPTFTGMPLDRAMDERMDPAVIARLLDDPRAGVLAASDQGVLIGDGDSPSMLRVPVARQVGERAAQTDDQPMLLGLDEGAPLFALDLDELPESDRDGLIDGGRVVSLREAGAILSRSQAGLAAYVAALLNWHRSHRYCANCGAHTLVREAGYARRCARCQTTHFPRTDPVVIMTVEHDDRLLLGRRPGWPGRRYSTLAGFVSPGRVGRGGGDPRGGRGVRDRGPRPRVRQLPAVAVPALADARLRRAVRGRSSRGRATASSRTCAGLTTTSCSRQRTATTPS